MKIVISNDVKGVIHDIFNYSVKYSFNYASNTVRSIYKTISEIKDFPYLGKYVPEIMDKHFREILCNGYRIMYFVSEKGNLINIQYVLSSRQNRTQFLEVHKKEIFDIINFLNQFI